MGTDIHAYFEAQTPDGVWQMIEEVDAWRNYAWFGFAASVRREFSDSLSPRGMPNSPSSAWEDISERWGFHSLSWLTPGELREVNIRWHSYCTRICEEEADEFNEFIKPLSPDHIITNILVADTDNGNLIKIPFAGTLAEFVGSDDIENKVRLVFGFDS